MRVEQLTLQHFRGYDNTTFDFKSGMNLLVGVNGAGKSSVLEALRLLLSHMLPVISASKDKPFNAREDDIAVGAERLYANLRIEISDVAMEEDMRVWRRADEGASGVLETGDVIAEGSADDIVGEERTAEPQGQRKNDYRFLGVSDDRQQRDDAGSSISPVEQKQRNDRRKQEIESLPKKLRRAIEQVPAIYFSAHRSLINVADETKRERSIGGQAAAFVDALDPERQLKVAEFARWWVVFESLTRDPDAAVAARATAQKQAFEQAVTHFLDGFTNVQAVDKPKPTLLLNKAGTTLDVRMLSDGERSMLAIVLDIARRLSQANPQLADPLREGQAIVLIDELDLHLHPQWQRMIVQKLTETFPQCQFIATTHSPQIIGEVAPEQIIILEVGKQPYQPDQSLGMDSNWILQFLMGTPNRNVTTNQQLERISDLIEDAEYEQAATEIAKLRQRMPDDPELVKLQVRLARMQILGT